MPPEFLNCVNFILVYDVLSFTIGKVETEIFQRAIIFLGSFINDYKICNCQIVTYLIKSI